VLLLLPGSARLCGLLQAKKEPAAQAAAAPPLSLYEQQQQQTDVAQLTQALLKLVSLPSTAPLSRCGWTPPLLPAY
jgi:hypothetical protein